MNMDDKLFNYYLELKSPEAGEWNSSPECIHTELITRDYVRREFTVTDGIKVCNVGIRTGDWDDYLGYWLKGKGDLTSIDINKDICEIFAYRFVKSKSDSTHGYRKSTNGLVVKYTSIPLNSSVIIIKV